ncbi:phosphotransferase [Candidatus Woesearchaeota archaeon]|jgi:hypothetical protein|nr:phosphotransferase [Candidatus Woesearchaeota archaeon]
MTSESLEQRLDSLVTQNPNKYEPEVVERVSSLLQYEQNNPGKRKKYRKVLGKDEKGPALEEHAFPAYVLYHAIHPEWQGLTPKQLERSRESRGDSFYQSLNVVVREIACGNKKDAQALKDKIFTNSSIKYRDWKDSEQAIANLEHALYTDIPELEELGNVPDSTVNKDKVAELIKARIKDHNYIANYFSHLEVNSAASKKHCPVFKGNKHYAIATALSKFGLDPIADLGGRYTGWKDAELAIANGKNALFSNIPRLKELIQNPLEGKAEAAELLKKRIEEYGKIEKYLIKIKIRSSRNPNLCPVFEGLSSKVITKSLHEFDFHPVHDLGLNYTNWGDSKQAEENVRDAVFHDTPELLELAKDGRINKREALRLIHNRIDELGEGNIDLYFINAKISTAGMKGACHHFDGNRYNALAKSLHEFGFTMQELMTRPPPLYEHIRDVCAEFNVDDTIENVSKKIIDYGYLKFTAISRGIPLLARTLVAEHQWAYVEARREATLPAVYDEGLRAHFNLNPRNLWKTIQSLDALNILKLAQDENGNYLSQQDYSAFIREVLDDKIFLERNLGNAAEEFEAYLANGDYSDVSIIEELIDAGSKNPNFRIRMLLATNQNLQSNETLDTFVKLYSAEEEETRNFEAAMINYLNDIVGLESVGKARTAKLATKIHVERENGDGLTTYFQSLNIIKNREDDSASYALIIPYVNISTLHEHVNENPDMKKELLDEVTEALYELHSKGIANLERISEMADKDYEILKSGLRLKDYREKSNKFVFTGTELAGVYSQLGIDDILNDSAFSYTSVIHGDAHPKNIAVNTGGNYIFLDAEMAALGAPQIDEARLYAHRDFGLSIDEQTERVKQSAEKRGVKDVDDYLIGYHAAIIFKTLEHARYVHSNLDDYGVKKAQKLLDADFDIIREHGNRIYSNEDVSMLVDAAINEFKLKKSIDETEYKKQPNETEYNKAA